MPSHQFSFERKRGIAWVCDLAGSSRLLNDDTLAAPLEDFLPRLHWFGMMVVEAAGGRFIKWTGDGFLAWFETPLHRDLGRTAATVLQALWQLTVCVNVTQLGVKAPQKFRLRHGLAYEQDALFTRIRQEGCRDVFDITGRGVVLAFRLSGITSPFPGFVAPTELLRAARGEGRHIPAFRSWRPSHDELLKYFKGERWGTRSLSRSDDRRPQRRPSATNVLRKARRAILSVETPSHPGAVPSFVTNYLRGFDEGPAWARQVRGQLIGFITNDLIGSLKGFVAAVGSKESPDRDITGTSRRTPPNPGVQRTRFARR